MKLIITRSKDDCDLLEALALEHKISTFTFPCISFAKPSDEYAALDKAIRTNHLYDWVFFLSKKAVEVFFTRLFDLGGQFYSLSPHLKFAVIGAATADFLKNETGFPVDFMPSAYSSDVFAQEFLEKFSDKNFLQGQDSSKILLVRAELDDESFEKQILSSGQFVIDTVLAYKTELPNNADLFSLKEILGSQDKVYISFASSQTVKNFKNLAQSLPLNSYQNLAYLSIGPKTTDTIIRELQPVQPVLESKESSFGSLLETLMIK